MSQSIPTWCWYCKREIPVAADVCPHCGKPLSDKTKVVRCRKCGKFLLKNAPRCAQCGEPTPQPAPPVPPGWPSPPNAGAAPPSGWPSAPGAGAAPPAGSPSGQNAGAAPPTGWPSAQNAKTAVGTPETMKMLEELERLNARETPSGAAKNAPKRKNKLLTGVITAVLLIAAGVGIFFGVSYWREKNPKPDGPVYCGKNEHVWIEADCTAPKTCAVCGKTEGEPAGHQFVANVCAVCGEYERLFYFSDSESERNGSEVIFRGRVKNYTGEQVQSLQIKAQLYDENRELVETLSGTVVEGAGLAPLESATWQIRYGNSSVEWKYWRVYVADYTPKP